MHHWAFPWCPPWLTPPIRPAFCHHLSSELSRLYKWFKHCETTKTTTKKPQPIPSISSITSPRKLSRLSWRSCFRSLCAACSCWRKVVRNFGFFSMMLTHSSMSRVTCECLRIDFLMIKSAMLSSSLSSVPSFSRTKIWFSFHKKHFFTHWKQKRWFPCARVGPFGPVQVFSLASSSLRRHVFSKLIW